MISFLFHQYIILYLKIFYLNVLSFYLIPSFHLICFNMTGKNVFVYYASFR